MKQRRLELPLNNRTAKHRFGKPGSTPAGTRGPEKAAEAVG